MLYMTTMSHFLSKIKHFPYNTTRKIFLHSDQHYMHNILAHNSQPHYSFPPGYQLHRINIVRIFIRSDQALGHYYMCIFLYTRQANIPRDIILILWFVSIGFIVYTSKNKHFFVLFSLVLAHNY